jgi:hypothetical protein
LCTSKLARKHRGKAVDTLKGVTLAKGKISKVKILEGYSVVSGSMSGERSESLFSSGRHVRSFQGSPAKQIFDVSRVQAL